MRFLIAFLFLVISSTSVFSLENGDRIPKEDTLKLTQKFARYFEFREDKNWVYIPVPTTGYSPETDVFFGLAQQLFYRTRKDTLSTASSLSLAGFYTLNNQFLIFGDWTGFFGDDRFIVRSSFGYKFYPLNFFGIGNRASKEAVAIYAGNSLSFDLALSQKVSENIWVGPSLSLSSYLNNRFTDVIDATHLDIEGKNGFWNVGLGGSFRFDTRDNKLYSQKGIFLETSGLFSPKFIGSNTNNFIGSIDFRSFYSPKKGKHTFAYQIKTDHVFGSIPFQKMSSIGGERIIRGYYYGRYRDKHAIALQSEYRFPIIEKFRIRGNVFVSVGDVFNEVSDISLPQLKASIGGGLRYMLDNKTKTTVRFDYARTREGDNGFYIGVMEAF